MKKAVLFIFTAVLSVIGSFSVSAQGKFGPDSAECIKYLSYYKEYYKQKNYDQSLPNWRKAYELCPPTANQTMIIDGTMLIRKLIHKNANNAIYKDALIDTLMRLHDIRAEYYPKYSVTALNNKGLDMINYIKDDPSKMYEEFDVIINKNQTDVKPQILLFQMNTACQLFQNGALTAEDVINQYNSIMDLIGAMDDPKEAETIEKIRTDIESIFIGSKVADCDNLIALFTPRYEAAPNDLQLVTKIVHMLSSTEGCQDNDLYLNAATSMHSIEPTFNSAYFLYKLYSVRGEVEKALEYMTEAIASPDSDVMQDAQYCYEAATLCLKNTMNVDAVKYAQKAAESDPALAGKAYMLIGTIWGSQVCKGDEIARRAPYWVAVDYMVKAKNADESLTEDANKNIAQFRTYYPQTAEAFMYNLVDGDAYEVRCGGLSAVTTVKTQQ